ncbi:MULTISPECIES: GTPase HflX [unclassified Ruminococcus]|uniref:GTPase HflX n=1 Tax=unclassified Ruminococcus TaxID=2608920 RepID=UPI00210D50A9|nr:MULTISPECIES: GTPase HflX [unclassified Ruminococcus]MCQ4021484.1 GTPase HflX [Ruminococcus sp. zg-924]MCQ4113929.1 GTPase HflX [Ruminococcus sp. zg-921]
MEFYENEEIRQQALLVAVDTGEYDAESSMAELYELAKTAGADVLSHIIQKREAVKTATCVGSGCLEEIAEYCKNNDIDLIIFDRELTPTQIRNIEDKTDVRVIDRTMLILDIFAQRARSKEGKLQVELAQLKYMLPRLTGKGTAMSRLGGGIGTRGPGETKLETDKRHIRTKMEKIKERLKESENHREQLKKRRKKDGVITVAIVGYTNAGKSTLMNYLTDAGVLAQDKLFATLDPTSRALKLPSGVTVMLIDTVGLVRRLPHHLVEAFKSTLEEAAQADIILNVCDASSAEASIHLEVTQSLLESLGCSGSPIIPVLNKCDRVQGLDEIPIIGKSVRISAKTGQGVERLLEVIDENLPIRVKKGCWVLPFDKVGLSAEIRRDGTLISESYTENGLEIEAIVDESMYERLKSFKK